MAIHRLLGTAAALALITAPAMAQQVMGEPGYCAFYYPNANCQNRGPGSPYTGSYRRQAYRDQAYRDRASQGSTWENSIWQNSTWQNSYNRFDDNSGFWPGDVAAGVVGGAVGTAAAIATSPVGGD